MRDELGVKKTLGCQVLFVQALLRQGYLVLELVRDNMYLMKQLGCAQVGPDNITKEKCDFVKLQENSVGCVKVGPTVNRCFKYDL